MDSFGPHLSSSLGLGDNGERPCTKMEHRQLCILMVVGIRRPQGSEQHESEARRTVAVPVKPGFFCGV